MKVTIDLSKHLADGTITQAEADKLIRLSSAGTSSLAFNILIGFGFVAVSRALVALAPTPVTGIVIGVVILAAGLGVLAAKLKQWEILGQICTLIGALLLAGGIVILANASVAAFLLITAGFVVIGSFLGSGLLISLAVLAVSSSIGARTGYEHATYMLGMEEPTITIALFSLMAIATFQLSKFLPRDFQHLALMAARTSVLLVNFGFWIGSLWGDQIETLNLTIPDWVFSIVWALALLITGIWAAKSNRRWVVNSAAVFGAIHFYTQWFERLGTDPTTVLIAGVVALGIAVALRQYNRQLQTPVPSRG